MSMLTRTRIYRPRHSLVKETSTCSSVPSVVPMASAFARFIRRRGRPWICIQKEALVKVASSTDSSSLGLYSPIKYLSKDQGPCARIFIGSISLSKSINTVLSPRSRTSKFWTERHMLRSVRDKASILTLRLVNSFATRTLLLLSISGVRLTSFCSVECNDRRAHLPVRSSMVKCKRIGGKGDKRGKEWRGKFPPKWGKGGQHEVGARFSSPRLTRDNERKF